jgi:outer membrane murein-binding lipoprotein Lpp
MFVQTKPAGKTKGAKRMNRNIIAATACIVAVLVLAACQTTTKTEQISPMSVTATYDLTVLSVSAPATAARGANISVIHTTKNVGTTAAPVSTSKFYLCTNNVACGYQNSQNVLGLAAGASSTLTNTITIPVAQALGTNYVVIICATNLSQDDKSNNTNSTAIVITQ